MPFQLHGLKCKLSTEFLLSRMCTKAPVDSCGIRFGSTKIRLLHLTEDVGKHSGPPFLFNGTQVLRGERGDQWLSPSMSAAWVIQESYSQVKLWPFNGTYCKGICWSLSRGTNIFICCGTRSMFAQPGVHHIYFIAKLANLWRGIICKTSVFLVVIHNRGL